MATAAAAAAAARRGGCVWPLLWLCVRLCGANPRLSMDDDLLLPYTQGQGPSYSHRYVRDCQPVAHGNSTHESWPAGERWGRAPARTAAFVSDVPGREGWVYGHLTVVGDPLRTLSVLEPGGPGGCDMNQRATVEETARAAGCLYAQNAGFFNTSSGQCLGAVVSRGRAVRDGGGRQNAHFGIRRDGTLVFGYLSLDEVVEQSNPFVQLVSGVGWLLRAGEVYLEHSLRAECDKTQETDVSPPHPHQQAACSILQTWCRPGRRWATTPRAGWSCSRSTDRRRREGEKNGRHRGNTRGQHTHFLSDRMSLWETAAFLKKNGVINAINLDGGGSSTAVTHGALSSYPSDHCEADSRWRCARHVSTILCVHPPLCDPADCSRHGDCVDGDCRCHEGWRGAACETSLCRSPACGAHGNCTAKGCVCDAGWRGEACDQECLSGFYGDGCNQTCSCKNGGSCDHVNGHCSCPAGFHGNSCEQVCPLGFFGPSCSQECRCDDLCPCDPQTGSCNVTLLAPALNDTSHTAGQCLAKQMFTRWRREEEAQRQPPHLTEPVWLLLCVSLAGLLSLSLLLHVLRARGAAAAGGGLARHRRRYSYVPLSDINGGGTGTNRHTVLDHSDSQEEEEEEEEEVWTPS